MPFWLSQFGTLSEEGSEKAWGTGNFLFIYLFFYKMREMKYQIPDRDTKWDMRQQRLLCEQSLRWTRLRKPVEQMGTARSESGPWSVSAPKPGPRAATGGLVSEKLGNQVSTPKILVEETLHPPWGYVCGSYMGGALKGQISLQLKKQSTPVYHMWVHLLMVGSPLHHFWGQVAQHPGLPR